MAKGSAIHFSGLMVLVSFIGLVEFYRMSLPERRAETRGAAVLGAFLPLSAFGPADLFQTYVILFFLLFALLFLFRLRDIAASARETGLLSLGFLYVPVLLTPLQLLRLQPHGVQWIFLLLVLVMAGDSAAYYAGSYLGKTKLYPAVSPKKTIEGSLGGLAGTIVGAFIARATFFPELTIADAFLVAALGGPLGQLGDLFESLLKRSCGVKDSGSLFPGHGGILDRIDSILFAAPVLYWYSRWFFAS